MNAIPGNRSSRQPWLDWLLVLVVGVLIWAPTVDYFCHVDWSEPPEENRMPASWPRLTQWNSQGEHAYLAAVEAYFNDHFGFRKRLIRWCQQWRQRLYRSKNDNLVLTGQDGWYYFTEGQMVDHYLGLKKFTPHELRSWQRLLEKRRDWLAARGIHYLFVVPPDKQTIYPEHLPAWLVQSTPARRETALDQFLAYMKTNSTVDILDVRETLRAHKPDGPLYLENDTHWNYQGGFLAAQDVIQRLSQQLPQLPPLRREDYVFSNAPAWGGDMTSILHTRPPEHNYFECKPKLPLLPPRVESLTNVARIWTTRDHTQINSLLVNQNPTAQPVDLVLFHDSYAGYWYPFFGCTFHRCVFIWENREFNTNVIVANHPQVVINEILERMFYVVNPDEMLAREALP